MRCTNFSQSEPNFAKTGFVWASRTQYWTGINKKYNSIYDIRYTGRSTKFTIEIINLTVTIPDEVIRFLI
jgi:hypothetical protein